MTTGLLITRPAPQAALTAARVAALGYQPVLAPLMTIVPLVWQLPAVQPQTVLITSANALPALAESGLARSTPIYTVGAQTAAAIAAIGFSNVKSADGDSADLAALVSKETKPAAGLLLYLRGQDIAGDLQKRLQVSGYQIETRVVYRSDAAISLPIAVTAVLTQGEVLGALLYSPRSAAIFTKLAPHRKLRLYCLSQAVAQAAGAGWTELIIAAHPDENSLLELLPKV
jgi:uroporphyrinogen-III synthase